jgi:flagellar assembly factor FliW
MLDTATRIPLAPTDPPAEIHFPEGLVGCEHWRHFLLEPPTDLVAPVWLLRCLDEPGCNLMLADPRKVSLSYAYEPQPEDRQALDLGDAEPVLFCTLSIGEDGWINANLLGPLMVNPATGQGRQVVLTGTHYPVQFRVAQLRHG